jgi:hypothetical protein
MLSSSEIDLLEEIFSQNTDLIDIGFNSSDSENEILSYLNNSLLMKEYDAFQIHKLAKFSDSNYETYIIIIEVDYSISRGKYPSRFTENQIIGLKKLNRAYGNIFIRPETFEDKVSKLFIKSEIDFPDYPKFSLRYFFTADTEFNAKLFATSERLKCIEKQNEIKIVVNEDVLISKFSRIITYEDCTSMIEFIKSI